MLRHLFDMIESQGAFVLLFLSYSKFATKAFGVVFNLKLSLAEIRFPKFHKRDLPVCDECLDNFST